jgi:hypothetical protein
MTPLKYSNGPGYRIPQQEKKNRCNLLISLFHTYKVKEGVKAHVSLISQV